MKFKCGRRGVSFFLILLVMLAVSCEQDAYEKGEGPYSLMRADFVEAHANGQKEIDYFVTDDGETLWLTETMTAKWLTTADSIYRCVFYYNKVERDDNYLAQPYSVGLIPCASILEMEEVGGRMKTDPVRFESAWMSRSGKYLNLSLYLLTGTTEDEKALQRLAIVCDTVVSHANGIRTKHLLLYHDQGDVPEYYSTQAYISLLSKDIDADSVRISINTYKGMIEKSIAVKMPDGTR